MRKLLTSLYVALVCFSSAFAKNDGLVKELTIRGPTDIAVATDARMALTINELSRSVSLVDLISGTVIHEQLLPSAPATIVSFPQNRFAVSCPEAAKVMVYEIQAQTLHQMAEIELEFEPSGLAIDYERRSLYVSLMASGEVMSINLDTRQPQFRTFVGLWPRYITLSPDGSKLVAGLSGESQIAVMDAGSGEVLYSEPLSGGINLGHMQCSQDGSYVYFPWMVYRSNPITVANIRRGWVLASRIGRVRLDGPSYREAISLDVPRLAVADPHGLILTPDQKRLAVSSSGTHELLVYRMADLPFVGAGGPGDLIDEKLLLDQDLFYRLELGGRPLGLRSWGDGRFVLVANQLRDSVQIVDIHERKIDREIFLGKLSQDEFEQQVQRGREIFFDARRSLDQWYSCHSCHQYGGTNAKAMDTWNDGSELTSKTVIPLENVAQTGPWTWHGWQDDLDASLRNSFTSTMQGEKPTETDVAALKAFLAQLRSKSNPFAQSEKQAEAAARGKSIFESQQAGCAECHSGPLFTDGKIHDVGLGAQSDRYEGYNTPSLIGVFRKPRLLHDGRAKTLEAVLGRWHRAEEIGGGSELSEKQLQDLIAYLQSL
ncbi:MAG: c-type cytochrome [Planctomycetales bacterium]|nr:c-type cytochrome [Planctomycetales bacterium]